MKDKGKRLIELIICLGVILVTTGVGKLTGFWNNLKLAQFDLEILQRLVIMVVFVIAVERLCILLLSFTKKESHRLSTVATIFSSLIRYAAALIIICWGLTIIGVNVSTIAASVGIVALIVGFGAESLIEDVITGIFMLFENQYNVGDIIEINGFRGTVSNIGIRTTSITDAGGNVKIINNSNMKDLLNRSNQVSRAISEIDIPYETDIEAFELLIPDMMETIYQLHTDKMLKKPEYLGVSNLGPSGVTLKFCVEVEEKNIYSMQRVLNRDLWVFFRKANVEVPFPQLDVHQK